MSVFFDAGKNASELLQEYGHQMPDEIKSLLRSILKLCLIGQKLEAENADLRNQLREALERGRGAEHDGL